MPHASQNYLVGVISDTHGRLPRPVAAVFRKVDLIIHAGDIGDPKILQALKKIAPTKAVRGNMDMDSWAHKLPKNEIVKIGQILLYLVHDLHGTRLQPGTDAYDAVVSGHTHRPAIEKRDGVLYINPGSAVQPRFGYPPSVALLEIKSTSIQARLVELKE